MLVFHVFSWPEIFKLKSCFGDSLGGVINRFKYIVG